MNRLRRLVLAVTLLASLAACTGTAPSANQTPTASVTGSTGEQATAGLSGLPESESLLFVLQANSGKLESSGGEDFTYNLRLDTARHTTWFSDRPARDGGTISTETVVSDWGSLGFGDVAPNAVLTIAGGEPAEGEAEPLIVELGVPSYDSEKSSLRFPVKVIGRTTTDGLEGSFGAASLFIDNATFSNGCGYTGEIDYFPSSVTPAGYELADGHSRPKAEYPELYAVLGDRFGADATTFQMPTVDGPGPNLHALVCASGGVNPAETDPDSQRDYSCVVGRVQLFAQETPVYGYVLANGQELPIGPHSWLYSYSGTRFGGDGVTTFGTPTMASPAGTSQQVCAARDHQWVQSNLDGVGNCYMSEVGYWATTMGMPQNWLPTGVLMPILQNTALFSLIGTTFGGDGVKLFVAPTMTTPDDRLTTGICLRGPFPPQV